MLCILLVYFQILNSRMISTHAPQIYGIFHFGILDVLKIVHRVHSNTNI